MVALLLQTGIILGLITAFIVLLLEKLKIISYMVEKTFLSKLFQCEFCLCFWLNYILIIPVGIYTGNFYCLLLPILATPVSRKLLW
jgi:hypothetical protein